MKTTKSGKSVLQNILTIIAEWEDDELNAFTKFSRRKRERSETKYFRLFKHLYDVQREGILENEVIEEKSYEWIKKTKLTNSINDLTQDLYAKLLRFLAERFREQLEPQWIIDVQLGLYEVQALMERRQYTLATDHLLKIEKKAQKNLPNQFRRLRWEDYSVFVKFANLKTNLIGQAERSLELNTSEEDDFFDSLHDIAENYVLKLGNQARQHSTFLRDQLDLEGTKMLFFQFLEHKAIQVRKYSDLRNIYGKIHQLLPIKEGLLIQYSQEKEINIFERGLITLDKYFWILDQYFSYLALGFNKEAADLLWRFFHGKVDQDSFGMATFAWLVNQTSEYQLAAEIASGEVEESEWKERLEGDLAHLQLFVIEHIKELPLRIELNRILLLCYSNCLESAEVQLLKVSQMEELPKSIKYGVDLLNAWVKLEMNRYPQETTDELYRKLQRKKDCQFEKSIANIMKGLSPFNKEVKGYWKKIFRKSTPKI